MMDTVSARQRIGFPSSPTAWATSAAVYDVHSLRIASHPVMEDWEAGYMQTLARIAGANGGRVLEVGYGLGLSARAIHSHTIERHVLIECHPDVISRCVQDFHGAMAHGRLHLMSGFWQDLTPLLQNGSFDGILFHTYPLSADELHCNHFAFFAEAYRLLKPGGILTYYSDEAHSFSTRHLTQLRVAGFLAENIHSEVCMVDPPEHCEYWRHNTILAPIVRK